MFAWAGWRLAHREGPIVFSNSGKGINLATIWYHFTT
jgi:hypothetical protein